MTQRTPGQSRGRLALAVCKERAVRGFPLGRETETALQAGFGRRAASLPVLSDYTIRVLKQKSPEAASSEAARPGYNANTTLNNGYLGSRTDEERSEMRYLV